MIDLKTFLTWAIGPGGGVLAYLVIKYFRVSVRFNSWRYELVLDRLSPVIKRRLGIVLPGLLAALAWLGSVWLGYNQAPAGREAWLSTLFQIALAPIFSFMVHGEVDLRNKDKIKLPDDGRGF